MTQPKMILGSGFIIGLLLCCLSWMGYSYYRMFRQAGEVIDPNIGNVTVTAGSLEVIVPPAHDPDVAFVSPTGHWLVYLNMKAEKRFIIDLQTGQERLIDFDFYNDVRWLNEEEFAASNWIVNAKDFSILKLQESRLDIHQDNITALEVLRGAKRVYLLPERGTGGVDVMSGDPAYPYSFDAFVARVGQRPAGMKDYDYTYIVLQERFPETEFVVVKSQYFQPTAGIRFPGAVYDKNRLDDYRIWNDLPSPDGRFYARRSGERDGVAIQIFQCGKELVAHSVKDHWHMYPKGWAYDGSGFYFFLQPKGGWFGTGGSSVSVLKLNLPPEVLANAPPYEGEGFCE